MSNINEILYNLSKKTILKYLQNKEKKLIIIAGSGSSGKTTLLHEISNEIQEQNYITLYDMDIKDIKDYKNYRNKIIEISRDLSKLPINNEYFIVNMTSCFIGV
jgi:uridine kinase